MRTTLNGLVLVVLWMTAWVDLAHAQDAIITQRV
jgi:hypothetical protein